MKQAKLDKVVVEEPDQRRNCLSPKQCVPGPKHFQISKSPRSETPSSTLSRRERLLARTLGWCGVRFVSWTFADDLFLILLLTTLVEKPGRRCKQIYLRMILCILHNQMTVQKERQDLMGFEPTTFAIPEQTLYSWATKPQVSSFYAREMSNI